MLPNCSSLICLWVIVLTLCNPIEGHQIGKRDSNKCTLPEFPVQGSWSVASGSNSPYLVPGYDVAAGTALNVQCNPGYKLSGPAFIICIDVVWSSPIGKCEARCPPISSTTATQVTCINKNGEELENCTSVESGTWAKFTCNKFYEFKSSTKSNNSLLCEDGAWKHEYNECVPKCGRKQKSSNGHSSKYPWVVGIYHSKDKKYACGGTLISERVILANAYCTTYFSNNRNAWAKPAKDFIVAAGKFYSKFDDKRDTKAQIRNLKDIIKSDTYVGTLNRNHGDISVLITEEPFVLSEHVQPVCIDWDLKYENHFTDGLVNGTITGWRFDLNDSKPLDSLKELRVPYIPYDNCLHKTSYEVYFTKDKLCAGYEKRNVSVCNRDTGAGLVFKAPNKRYYLVGITSIPATPEYLTCENKQYTLYTKVSIYLTNLIFEKLQDAKPIEVVSRFQVEKVNLSEPLTVIKHSQSLCGLKNVKSETLIVGGKNATKGDYPWQIALYDTTTGDKNLICGGSLISSRLILTAAHCVTDQHTNEVKPKERYLVVAGKYYRKFDDPRDDKTETSSLKEIFVPPQYEGDAQNYMADIAILVTEKSFKLSKYIQPICIDWDNKYEDKIIGSGVKGFVSGWGNTMESGQVSEVLKDLEVPYVDRQKCKTDLPSDYTIFLTFDKICSGFLQKSTSVCRGDSGSGMVFKIPESDRYFIAGIVSLAPRAPTVAGGCDSQQYSLYTRVSHYITSFILAKFRLFL